MRCVSCGNHSLRYFLFNWKFYPRGHNVGCNALGRILFLVYNSETPECSHRSHTSRTLLFKYNLKPLDQVTHMGLVLQNVIPNVKIPEFTFPFIKDITYDFDRSTLVGICASRDSILDRSGPSTPCLEGSFSQGEYITFSTTGTGTIPSSFLSNSYASSSIRAVGKRWFGSKSAGDFSLSQVNAMDGSLSNQMFISEVAPKEGCSVIKVCYAGEGGGEMVSPIGPMLLGLRNWGKKCLASSGSSA